MSCCRNNIRKKFNNKLFHSGFPVSIMALSMLRYVLFRTFISSCHTWTNHFQPICYIQNSMQWWQNLLKQSIYEEILPAIENVAVDSPDLLNGQLDLFHGMLSLATDFAAQCLATEIVQSLIPLTLDSQLSGETSSLLFGVLHTMLDRISQERERSVVDFGSEWGLK